MRRIGLTLCAILVGIGVGLGVAEVALRAWETVRRTPVVPGVAEGPKTLRVEGRIRPNLDVMIRRHPTSGRDVRVRTNSLGLRGPDLLQKRAGEIRVLVLGDSITFAEYVDEEETYPAILERALAAVAPRRTVRVLNGGGPNVGTPEEADLLQRLAPLVEPDLVLVAFYLNDGLPPTPYPASIDLPTWISWSRLADRGATMFMRMLHRQHHGAHVRWAREFKERRWVNDRDAFDRLIALAETDWGVAWRDYSWPVVEEALERIIRLGRRDGFNVAVAAFPVSIQVESRFEDDRPQQRVRQLTTKLGLSFIDLLPVLRSAADKNLFYDHCHLTPHGNELVATVLAPFVVRQLKTNLAASAARLMGLQVQVLDVRTDRDLEPAFDAAMKQRAHAVIVGIDALTQANRTQIVEALAKRRLPAISREREFVDAGGLISYGTHYADLYRRAATYVDKILKAPNPPTCPSSSRRNSSW